MQLIRSHGAGNDYLVLDRAPADWALSPAAAVLLCDRHRGVGGDGVLVPTPSARADYGLRIWNPDGSQAEKSGNGLRIFARFLVDHRGAPPEFSVEVPGGVVRCRVYEGDVAVQMGRPSFEAAEIPVARALLDATLEIDGASLRATAVGMGNPHCVILLDEALDPLPWRRWGATLERHPLFPNRTNVQFARVLSRGVVEARIWERGAGETASSGSSACAIFAATRRQGLVDADITVVSPGGELRVSASEDGGLLLRGPVEEVGTIALSSAFTKKLMAIG